MNSVEVVTGARLHFGLICGGPSSTNHFGGIGVMLRTPRWVISASQAKESSCTAASVEVRQRIETFLPGLCQYIGIRGLCVSVRDEIPLHRGLGAGTQLTLALASLGQVAGGHPRPASSMRLAGDLNRMRRSAVGTFGFDRGGFIVDDGQPGDQSDRLLHRYELPEKWHVVLIAPVGSVGLSGAREELVFREERHMPEHLVRQQECLIRDSIVPAAKTDEFERFRNALGQYGRNAGHFFATQQGGVYSSSVIRQLSQTPDFQDLPMVQSSWGPTVAVFTHSREYANDIMERILQSAFASELECQIAETLNSGAIVRSAAPENSDYVVRG
jgi:beta-ribofuranosylaminobenzene 5'-phosphate synthase